MIPAFLLIVAAVAYRIVTGLAITSGTTWLSNFAPLAAIALCAAAYFPAKYRFSVPMIALLVSDIVVNTFYGFSLLSPFVLSHYVGFAIVGVLGLLLRNRASVKTMLPASIAASILFYVVTGAVSWLFDPGYPKSIAGLFQSLTIGVSAYSATPSWMFFRNSVVSDLIFTGLFILCFHWGRASESVRATAGEPRTI